MSVFYSEEEVVLRVAGLTRARLMSYVEAELVQPARGEEGAVYRQIDIARLQLIGDLTEHFDLTDDGLAMVLRLIDQMHRLRSDLRCVVTAIQREPDEVRDRLARAVTDARSAPAGD